MHDDAVEAGLAGMQPALNGFGQGGGLRQRPGGRLGGVQRGGPPGLDLRQLHLVTRARASQEVAVSPVHCGSTWTTVSTTPGSLSAMRRSTSLATPCAWSASMAGLTLMCRST